MERLKLFFFKACNGSETFYLKTVGDRRHFTTKYLSIESGNANFNISGLQPCLVCCAGTRLFSCS